MLETIAPDGTYISTVGREVIDRGQVTADGEIACFASARSAGPPNCWRIPPVEIGETREYTNDHGGRMAVTRVAYTPLPTR